MHQNSLPHYILEQTDVGVNKLFLGTYSPIVQPSYCMTYIYKAYRSDLCRFLTNKTQTCKSCVLLPHAASSYIKSSISVRNSEKKSTYIHKISRWAALFYAPAVVECISKALKGAHYFRTTTKADSRPQTFSSTVNPG